MVRGCVVTPCCCIRSSRRGRKASGRALCNAAINHVTQVATRYQRRICAWDVVNEAFADSGSGQGHDSDLQRTDNSTVWGERNSSSP
jgi:GH35 family endo-1,4-beta-xylanase